jgi:hypothetical protein
MSKEAMKLALELKNSASAYWTENEIPIIEKLIELLADPMREVQRLGQEIEQEPVAWPCLIDSADFSENTITLVMQCEDYKVSAGTHWLSTTPPKENT